jgi:hypothetical protein
MLVLGEAADVSFGGAWACFRVAYAERLETQDWVLLSHLAHGECISASFEAVVCMSWMCTHEGVNGEAEWRLDEQRCSGYGTY